jgi:hypothetical protein
VAIGFLLTADFSTAMASAVVMADASAAALEDEAFGRMSQATEWASPTRIGRLRASSIPAGSAAME